MGVATQRKGRDAGCGVGALPLLPKVRATALSSYSRVGLTVRRMGMGLPHQGTHRSHTLIVTSFVTHYSHLTS